MSEEIEVNIDGRRRLVSRKQYVAAKTKQLREFGYTTLTEADVSEQIDALLAGKTVGNGLNVIGGFMESEVMKS